MPMPTQKLKGSGFRYGDGVSEANNTDVLMYK